MKTRKKLVERTTRTREITIREEIVTTREISVRESEEVAETDTPNGPIAAPGIFRRIAARVDWAVHLFYAIALKVEISGAVEGLSPPARVAVLCGLLLLISLERHGLRPEL